MELTPETREQVRLSLLRYCMAGNGITLGLARQYLASEGMGTLTKEDVQAEINYLADPQKDLLRSIGKLISPEVQRYRTTAAGRDFLAQAGL